MYKIHFSFSIFLALAATFSLGAMTPFEKAAEGSGVVAENTTFSMKSTKNDNDREAAALLGKKVGKAAEQVWWVKQHFTFGDEKLKLSFPTIPGISTQHGLTTVVSHSKGVSYTLTGFNPGRKGIQAELFFDRLVTELNMYPFVLEEHEIEYLDIDGHSAFNAKQTNLETGKKIRSKYVVTPNNSYVLQVIYKNHHDCKCERFFESLMIE